MRHDDTSVMARIDGIDISHFQSGKINWGALKASGVKFLYHKATEGVTMVDAWYAKRRAEAKANGVRFGAYHFAHPDQGAGDAIREAKHFMSVAKPQPGDMRPMLDLETTGGLSRAALTDWVGDFYDEVNRQIGWNPVIYLAQSIDLDKTFGMYLWVPRYSDSMLPPKVNQPWKAQGKSWTVWQFSNGVYGKPDTVPGIGHVDINTLAGNPAETLDLLIYKGTTKPTPKPPAPKPKPVPPKPVPPKPVPPKPQPEPTPKPPAPKPVEPPLPPVPVLGQHLKVITWNVLRDRQPAAVLEELTSLVTLEKPDVLCLQECNDYAAVLNRVPGYNRVALYDIREQAEAMILVRQGLTGTNIRALQVTFDPDGPGPEIAGWYTTKAGGHTPAKFITLVTVEGVDFVSGHPAPSVQNAALRATHPRQWRSYQDFMVHLSLILNDLGPRRVVACDWNVDHRVDKGKEPMFPKAILNRLGMWRALPSEGTDGTRPIDYFGYKGVKVSNIRVIKFPNKSDHRPVAMDIAY